MPSFGQKSLDILKTLNPDLQAILLEAINYADFTLLEGARTPQRQAELFKTGATKTLDSKHLVGPGTGRSLSDAVDIAPFPLDFGDTSRFYFVAGVITSAAKRLLANGTIKFSLRYGGDWNRNQIFKDETFKDLGHFELDK